VLDINADGQDRAIAKERVLTACRLARAYGDAYDGYLDRVDDAMADYDIDRFEASEDTKLKRLLYPEDADEWLMASRSDRQDALDELSAGGWRVIREVLSESTPVDALIHRNTRDTLRKYEAVGLLDTTVPDRNPEQRKIELTEETRAVYDQIDEYTREFYKRAQQTDEAQTRAIGFVMTTYRQRLTSSLHAIEQSLKRRREGLRSGLNDASEVSESDLQTGGVSEREEVLRREYGLRVDQIGANSSDGQRVREFELSELEEFIAQLYDVPEDPKLEQLMQDLSELSSLARDTVIIFTQYTDTLDAIKEKVCVSHNDVGTYSGDGGEIFDADADEWQNVSKERVKREFTDPDGDLSILVCTDSASEGLNLQSCDAMVNYDMPWNPQIVEQRIGRIDRIGQRNKKVLVWNYIYDDTVEEDIYERLGERINLFEQAVGPLRPILDGLEGEVESVAMGESTKSGVDIAESAQAQSKEAAQKSKQVGLAHDFDDIQPEDIIDEAKLYGWTESHPDVGDIGYPNRPFDPLINPDVVKRLFTQSQVLRNEGWTFEMLDRELTEDEEAPYQKLYRLSIPENADPPISSAPPDDTVQSIYADEGEVLVSFDPEVLEWYPSVVIPLPQHGLFDHLLSILIDELGGTTEDEVIRVAGKREETGPRVWTEPSAISEADVATYATEAQRRLTLDMPLPEESTGRSQITDWLRRYEG
jgi:hypothetical protein